jgi:hypothetical protein
LRKQKLVLVLLCLTPLSAIFQLYHARLAAASDQVYNGQWFSPGTPPSSTTKTGRHDIAEILLKVALNTIKQTQVFASSILNKK